MSLPQSKRRTRHVIIATLATLGLVILVLLPGNRHASGQASIQSFNGRVAFTSDSFVYTIKDDGTDLLQLSTNGTNRSPAWSADGTRIAISRRGPQDTTNAIYVMNSDGSGLQKISLTGPGDTDPTWSPDGSKIAFTSTSANNSDVFVMNADGTNRVNLTNDPAIDIAPTWSPDGTRIAFVTSRDFPGITGDVTRSLSA